MERNERLNKKENVFKSIMYICHIKTKVSQLLYLIEHWVVAFPDPRTLGLPGDRYFDDGLDVDARQLSGLDHANSDLTR